MQIHELNNFTGTLGSGAYLAIDDGTDTGKISSQGLLAATEARIDNIIAGPAPSAEEIVDARLGADGVTYPSLGDAIRDQFSDVKSELRDGINIQNLINPNDNTHGFINADGTITSDTWYVCDFVKVRPETRYTVKSGGYYAFYDADKQFISRHQISNATSYTMNTGSTTEYVRITAATAPSNWILNEGDSIITSEWSGTEYALSKKVNILKQIDETLSIAGKAADAKAVGDIVLKLSPYKHGTLDIYECDFSGWYEGQQNDYSSDSFNSLTQYSHVISKFDELMANSDGYITKNALGTASGLDANNNSYTLYEYVFSPKRYADDHANLDTAIVPKVLMMCCQHGFEKSAVYGVYYFLKDLVENWDKTERLFSIRNYVEIKVIPVVNPYGFDNSSYLNANDVNLNRNYQVPNWTFVPSGSDASGAEPFDQPETAIVKDWVEDNDDAFILMDIHTNGRYNASGYNNMNPNMPIYDLNDWYYNKIYRAFIHHIESQTAMLPKLYPQITPDSGNTATSFCGRLQSDTTADTEGFASLWCSYYENIIGFTFEMFNGLTVSDEQIIELFSADGFKICSEMIGNSISEILKEYTKD